MSLQEKLPPIEADGFVLGLETWSSNCESRFLERLATGTGLVAESPILCCVMFVEYQTRRPSACSEAGGAQGCLANGVSHRSGYRAKRFWSGQGTPNGKCVGGDLCSIDEFLIARLKMSR
ncbi:MAG: hypothetical protein ACLQU2_02630 [Candidatus Binataceae bacterium]